mmetsp:Transcript_27848/g.41038  ORF Transcript_27848/g.41038 Transcript_27848/m.41038 type:complete len:173 (-) Transcript_27848:93-611(-)
MKKKLKRLKDDQNFYGYQKKAVLALAEQGSVDSMTLPKLKLLVQYGVALRNRDVGAENLVYSVVVAKRKNALIDFYKTNLRRYVEDETLRIDEPQDSIPEPAIPSLQETKLAEQREEELNHTLNLLRGLRDREWQEKILNAFEHGVEATNEMEAAAGANSSTQDANDEETSS